VAATVLGFAACYSSLPGGNLDVFGTMLLARNNMNHTTTLRASLSTIEGKPGLFDLKRTLARELRGSLESVRSSGVVNLTEIVAVEFVDRNAS